MIPVGLSTSTNFFVGKYIGKNRADLARRMSNLLLFVTLIWAIASMILVVLLREDIMLFYTDQEEVH